VPGERARVSVLLARIAHVVRPGVNVFVKSIDFWVDINSENLFLDAQYVGSDFRVTKRFSIQNVRLENQKQHVRRFRDGLHSIVANITGYNSVKDYFVCPVNRPVSAHLEKQKVLPKYSK